MSAVQVIVPRSTSTPQLSTTTTTIPIRVAALRPRLPTAASTPAEIISRSLPEDGPPVYTLRMGTVNIPDIPLEEILDYVSEYHLEVFENQSFKRDREAAIARAIAKRETGIASRELKLLQGNGGATSRRISFSGSSIASRSSAAQSESPDIDRSGNTVQDGRRPRPSYTHLYKKKRANRGSRDVANASASGLPRKRVAVEVQVPVKRSSNLAAAKRPMNCTSSSPQGVYVATATAVNIGTPSSSSEGSSSSSEEHDQVHVTKRQRLTGPSTLESKSLDVSTGPSVVIVKSEPKMSSQSMMDIAKPEPKISSRSMMDAAIGSPRSRRSSFTSTNSRTSGLVSTAAKPEPRISARSMTNAAKGPLPGQLSSSLTTSSPAISRVSGSAVPTTTKSQTKTTARSLVDVETKIAKRPSPPSSQTSSSSSSSSSTSSPSSSTGDRVSSHTIPAKATNSIPTPTNIRSGASATTATTTTEPTKRAPIDVNSNSSDDSTSESDSDPDSGSESYIIERILNHALSDPRTHAAELGQKSVMLYHVKWAGYDQLTWEPSTSFDDTSFIDTYWEQVEAEKVRKQKLQQQGSGGGGAGKRAASTVSSSSGGKTRGLAVSVEDGGKA